MSTESAYIEAINANPDDRTPQYVYADWLDEMGDPRGEAWRVLIEAGKSPWRNEVAFDEVLFHWWRVSEAEGRPEHLPEHRLRFPDRMIQYHNPYPTFYAAMNAAAIAWVRCHVDAV